MDNVYSRQGKSVLSPKMRLLNIILISLLHLIFIICVIHGMSHRGIRESISGKLIYLSPQSQPPIIKTSIAEHLELKNPNLVSIQAPDFQIESKAAKTPDYIDENLKPYLLSNAPTQTMKGDFSGVFDPRVRKKLAESNQLVSKPKEEKYKTIYLPGGGMMVDVGDGKCIVSMPKTNANDRGTTWSTNTVPCGKTDSEKFMDNVQRDLDARAGKKHQ